MGDQVEIKCMYCGRPHLFDKEKRVMMCICADCLEKLKKESELRKASAELS